MPGSRPVRSATPRIPPAPERILGEIIDAFYSAQIHGIEARRRCPPRHGKATRIPRVTLAAPRIPASGKSAARSGATHAFRGDGLGGLRPRDQSGREPLRCLKGPRSNAGLHLARRDPSQKSARLAVDHERDVFVQCYPRQGVQISRTATDPAGRVFAADRPPRRQPPPTRLHRDLTEGGFVLRYRPEESAPTGCRTNEGVFLICSFWLADNSRADGTRERSAQRSSRSSSILRNDVGLLAEEYDPAAKRFLGNFPQAFSHVGLINTAHNLSLSKGPADRRAEQ